MASEGARDAYGGGVGGKIQRRPPRKSVTPYDRPPTAIRNPSVNRSSGWLSKLVDPASRVISSGATRLFSSVFGKRLLAPNGAAEASFDSGIEHPKATSNSPPRAPEQGCNKSNDFGNVGINEVEELLKQKTFTKVEFDRLSQLLISRTVDSFADEGNKRTEPSTTQVAHISTGHEKETYSPHVECAASLGLFKSSAIPCTETSAIGGGARSPVELAKAYMGTRSSKVSSPSHFRNQIMREDVTSNTVSSSLSSPRMHFALRSPSLPENGYLNRTPQSRSALYSMYRSPHCKSIEPSDGKFVGASTSSQRFQNNETLSVDKKLKRRSSALNDDFGSVGPIRRIRQKMMSSFKDRSLNPMPCSLPFISDSAHGEPRYDTSTPKAAKNVDVENSNESLTAIPHRSSEMARRILEQLDKLVPSPRPKLVDQEKPPLNISVDRFDAQALNRAEDVTSPKLQNVEDTECLNGSSGAHLPKSKNFVIGKQVATGESNLKKESDLIVNSTPKPGNLDDSVVSGKYNASIAKPVDSIDSVPSAVALLEKKAFQMSAPEESLEMDDGDGIYSSKSTLNSPNVEREKLPLCCPDTKTIDTKRPIMEKPPAPGNVPAKSFMPKKGMENTTETSDGPNFGEKGADFTFPTTSILGPHELHATSPSSIVSCMEKEQATSQALVDSKISDKGSTKPTIKVGDAFSLKVGAVSTSKPALFNRNEGSLNSSPLTSTEAIFSSKRDKLPDVGSVNRSLENACSSGVSSSTTSVIFSFDVPTKSLRNSGPPVTTSSSVSAANVSFGGSTNTVLVGQKDGISACNAASISATSTSAPAIFKFGSGSSASSASLVPSLSSPVLNFSDSEPKTKSLSFSSISSVSSPSFTSTANGTFSASSGGSSTVEHTQRTQHFAPFAPSSVSSFGTQVASTASSMTAFSKSMPSQFGSSGSASLFASNGSSFGAAASTVHSACSVVGSTASGSNLVVSSSVFAPSPSSSFSNSGSSSSFSFMQSGTSSLFSSSSQSATTCLFGPTSHSTPGTPSGLVSHSTTPTLFVTSSQQASVSLFGSGTAPLFDSSSQPAAVSLFASSSQSAEPSIFSTGFTSASPATGFSFGASSSAAGSMPTMFGGSSHGSSSGSSVFSFTSAAAAPMRPMFGTQNPFGFGSPSPGNDQMNIEDSMTADTIQASATTSLAPTPAFSQLASAPSSPNFIFGSTATSLEGPSAFQFGAHQNPTAQQKLSPFAGSGSLEFTGGSFSLGAGGDDKYKRKIVRIRRDKLRKK